MAVIVIPCAVCRRVETVDIVRSNIPLAPEPVQCGLYQSNT